MARVVRRRGGTVLAVDRLCEDPCERRLAGAARACEEVRLPHLVLLDRVRQRPHDRLLAHDLREGLGAVLAIEGGHGSILADRAALPSAPRRAAPPLERCRSMLLTAALALALSGCPPPPPPPAKHVLTAPRWIHDTLVTEYWPAPERWFTGALVRVPGIPGRHRADWLFGARGLMEGEGLATNGRIYHFAGPYGSGWL